MRLSIFFLLLLILLLLANIVWYMSSQEYRFFIQKLKHPDWVIERSDILIDDSVIPSESNNEETVLTEDWVSVSTLKFLESITGRNPSSEEKNDTSEDLLPESLLQILDLLADFNLSQVSSEEYLFWVTPEYPESFDQWLGWELSLYYFSGKTYSWVFDIFDILSFELPITLNEVNNFWEQSFFINMDTDWQDEYVRIVFVYQNEVFWLKIKNNTYNEVRDALSVLRETF